MTTKDFNRLWAKINSLVQEVYDLQHSGHAGPVVSRNVASRIGGASGNASRPRELDTSFGAGGPAAPGWIRDVNNPLKGTCYGHGCVGCVDPECFVRKYTGAPNAPTPDYATEKPAEPDEPDPDPDPDPKMYYSSVEVLDLTTCLRHAQLHMPNSHDFWHRRVAAMLKRNT